MARRWLPLVGASGALLAWSGAVVPFLPAVPGVRTAANLAGTATLVLVVRAGGLSWRELGLSRARLRSGALWGGAALAAVTVGYLAMLALPAGRTVLATAPGSELSAGELALRVLVLIPLGTVVCEEVAFRGVLLALALRLFSPASANLFTAVVFGLWHLAGAARTVSPVLPSGASVLGTVAVTGAGGLVFGWLRLRSGSVLASMGLHLGTNSAGILAAALAR